MEVTSSDGIRCSVKPDASRHPKAASKQQKQLLAQSKSKHKGYGYARPAIRHSGFTG